MSDTGGSRRREPEVRPSKFGAGYTTGGPAALQSAPTGGSAPPVLPAPVVSELPVSSGAEGTGARAAVQVMEQPTPQPTVDKPTDAADRNVLATVSLVLAVALGAFLSPVTLVMAYLARAQIKKTGERGADLALAALVISYVFLFVGVAAIGLSMALP